LIWINSTLRRGPRAFWKEGQANAKAMAFWEDTLRYLYLPRLKTREDLAHVIRKEPRFFGTHTLEPDPENCFPIHGPSAR
jgi:hypothetical protein